MEMNDVITAINTVGFPIVCCLILAYLVYKMNVSHKEEMNQLKEALNQNTLVIQKLSDKLDNLFYKREDDNESSK